MTRKEGEPLLFLAKHLAGGVTGGLAFCAAIIAFDVLHLRTLLFAADSVGIGLYLLIGSVCFTFGGVAMVVGIMSLGDDADHPDREY